jgi:hypothetical protein
MMSDKPVFTQIFARDELSLPQRGRGQVKKFGK